MIPALPMASWLADRSLSELSELLYRRRRYLAGYRVSDFRSLGNLLQNSWPISGVLTALPLPALQVIEAHAVLGRSVTIDALAGLLTESGSPERHRASVVGVLDLLSADALAWSGDGVHSHLAQGFEQLIPNPMGLGPTAEVILTRMNAESMRRTLRELGLPRTGDRARLEATLREFFLDADGIRARVADAPRAIRAELEAEAAGTRVTSTAYSQDVARLAREFESWGMARALLYRDQGYQLVMPSQVRLALRGPAFRAPFDPTPGEIPTTPTSLDQIIGEAGSAALEFLAATTAILDILARQPAPALKDGGLGVREIRKLAKAARVNEARATTVLAVARKIGLISESNSRVGVSEHYSRWNRAEPDIRLMQLVMAWWQLPHTPGLAPVPEAAADLTVFTAVHHPDERILREATIRAFVEIGEARSVTDLAALSTRIAWSHPVLVAARAAVIPTIVVQAQELGVLGGTGASPMAFALSPFDERALRAAAGATLPAMTSTATFGSDLTVLVSGSPTAHVTTMLDGCADRESSGSASLWRFSLASIRRAFDEGLSAVELRSALIGIAVGPLPQPLEYLITDIGRRYGVVTVKAARCFLHSADDAGLLREICADRSLKGLGLQLIAPTVALSQQDSKTTLDTMRKAGYLPSMEHDPTSGIIASPSLSSPSLSSTDLSSTDLSSTDLPSSGSDLEELAKNDNADIDRMLAFVTGSAGQRKSTERSERQRARALAKALQTGRPGTR